MEDVVNPLREMKKFFIACQRRHTDQTSIGAQPGGV
jgi:hypothetical protein